jgi:hypothetical protein
MLRFTIRDVLWLMALVAMRAGWYSDHASQMKLRLEAAKIHHNDLRQLRMEAAAAKDSEAASRQTLISNPNP